jgi:hypothetical protein
MLPRRNPGNGLHLINIADFSLYIISMPYKIYKRYMCYAAVIHHSGALFLDVCAMRYMVLKRLTVEKMFA